MIEVKDVKTPSADGLREMSNADLASELVRYGVFEGDHAWAVLMEVARRLQEDD